MNRRIARLFTMPSGIDALLRLRVRYIQALSVLAMVAAVIGLIAQSASNSTTRGIPATAMFFVVGFALLLLVRQGYIRPASIVLVTMFVLSAIAFPSSLALLGTFAIISAATLGNRLVYGVATVAVLGKGIYDTYLILAANTAGGMPRQATDYLLILIALVIVSVTTRFFINQAEQSGDAAKANATLLQAVAETGEILAKLLNLSTLLPRAVELIQERFGFYHVQVFLLDETNEYASLSASTGATGQKLLERRHRLAVGSKSVIGQVTLTSKPVVARDTDAIYYRNELLPNTRAELALPVMDGDKMIGVLDVQSRRVDAFEAEAVQALQVMANLLGTSIRNARFFEQQDLNARESRRLFLESETNLREIQRLNQQLTNQGWENYLRNRRQINGVTLDQELIVADDKWSDILVKASQTRQAVTESSNGTGVIAVPVMLGSEVIGAIEVESGSGRENETIEMVKAVAQRLALSLDKARLYEESQEATAQEQRINEIVARYQTVSSVDDLLQITLSELSDSLGAKRGAIRLGVGMNSSLNGESQA